MPIEANLPDPDVLGWGLFRQLARGFRWKKLHDKDKYRLTFEMAESLGMNRWYMTRLLRLKPLAPDIVKA